MSRTTNRAGSTITPRRKRQPGAGRTPRVAAATDLVNAKRALARAIASTRQRGETQTAFALRIGDAPSQMSLVESQRLRGFSTERLLAILAAAGRSVTITVGPTSRTPGRIAVKRSV